MRACHDVHVNLSPNEGQVKYEIVLGGWSNTRSIIRTGGAELAEYLADDIVSCDEYRYMLNLVVYL